MIRRPPRSTLFPTRRSSDLLMMFLYIVLRFRKWQYGLGSVVALFHDVLIVLSCYTIFDGLLDRKSTRLNSSHANISYAVFCLKKKNTYLYGYKLYNYYSVHH